MGKRGSGQGNKVSIWASGRAKEDVGFPNPNGSPQLKIAGPYFAQVIPPQGTCHRVISPEEFYARRLSIRKILVMKITSRFFDIASKDHAVK